MSQLPNEAKLCREADGDQIAVIGENRKMAWSSRLKQLPEMGRGSRRDAPSVTKDGGISGREDLQGRGRAVLGQTVRAAPSCAAWKS